MLSHMLRAVSKSASAPIFISGNVANRTTTGTTLTVNTPSGALSGDLLVACCIADDATDTFTLPSGWTSRQSANGRAIFSLTSYDGTTSSYTFTFTSGTNRVQLLCFRYAQWGEIGIVGTSTTNPTAPGLSGVDFSDSLQLAMVSSTGGSITYSTPAGFSEIVPAQTSNGTSLKIVVNDSLVTGTGTTSLDFTRLTGSESGRAIQFIIKPS